MILDTNILTFKSSGVVKLKKGQTFSTATILIFILIFCSSVAAGAGNSSTQTNVSGNYSTNQTSSTYEGTSNIRGYWINNGPSVLNTVNVAALKNAGITDLFISTNKNDVEGTLVPFLNKFSGSGIRIHAWITCFKSDGKWYDPGTNQAKVNDLTSVIISISNNYNVHGIHLDAARYPGTAYKYNGTTHVTSFVRNIYNKIQYINSKNISGKHEILLSAALMPECSANGYYYGQDYSLLAPYLDYLVPMIYKGNYETNTAWISSVTSYISQRAGGKPVLAGLQTYRSDSYPVPIPSYELNQDIQAAYNSGASGYVLFKYGLTDTGVSGVPYYCKTDINKILAAAASVKRFIEKYEKLPSKVTLHSTLGTSTVDMPTFLYLLSKGLVNVNSKNSDPIRVIDYNNPSNPSETVKSGSISKTEYIKIANNILNSMKAKGAATDSASSSLGSIPYKNLIYTYCKIIYYYDIHGVLPSTVSIKPLSWPRVTSTDPANNTKTASRSSPITITFDDRIAGGTNYSKIYVKNLATGKTVPITKTISGNTLTIKTSVRPYETSYQVYLPEGAVKNNIGNSLISAYTYKFTTLLYPIKVVSTSPADNAINVPSNKVFTVTFNTNIKAGSNYWIELINSYGKTVAINKSISGNVLTIKPKNSLAESRYTLILHTGSVTNMKGNPLLLSRYQFSVGNPPRVIKTRPVNNAVNFSRTASITISFHENIMAGTNYSGIYIKNLNTGKKVSITKTIFNKTLILKTKYNRLSRNTYQVYLPTRAVKDRYGNSPSYYTFKFRTL